MKGPAEFVKPLILRRFLPSVTQLVKQHSRISLRRNIIHRYNYVRQFWTYTLYFSQCCNRILSSDDSCALYRQTYIYICQQLYWTSERDRYIWLFLDDHLSDIKNWTNPMMEWICIIASVHVFVYNKCIIKDAVNRPKSCIDDTRNVVCQWRSKPYLCVKNPFRVVAAVLTPKRVTPIS